MLVRAPQSIETTPCSPLTEAHHAGFYSLARATEKPSLRIPAASALPRGRVGVMRRPYSEEAVDRYAFWVVTEAEVQAFLLAWLTREGVGFVRASELPQDGDRCH